MKVSIMVTSYNLHDYIDNAIESVVCQDFPCDWELLIGDDGSSDGTLDDIEKWRKKYPDNIRIFVSERNNDEVKNGTRAARNRARLLENATGDYLIYLDGDDCWTYPSKIKEQLRHLTNIENEDCSCCAHNIEAYQMVTGEKYPMTSIQITTRKFTAKEYWTNYYFHTNTILFRKECKDLLLKYRNYLNDNLITYILLQYGKILYLDKLWARYNLTGDGLWTGKSLIYGRFRNLIYMDLEININPKLKYCCIKRHMGDFELILKNYKPSIDYNIIQPLVDNIDTSIFFFSTSLATDSEWKWKFKKFIFRIKIVTYKIIINYLRNVK